MATPVESIQQIADRIITSFENELNQTIPTTIKTVFRVMAVTLAGEIGLLQDYASDASKQRFPQTADQLFLELIGGLKGVTRKSGQRWRGQAEIEATGTTGDIPAGKIFVYNVTGITYSVDNGVPITPGTLTVDLTATDEGSNTTLANGTIIDISGAIPGISQTATVSATTEDGASIEDIEVYRQRVIDAYRLAPQGGSSADYELWGSEAEDVIAIYPYSADYPSAVYVYVEAGDQPDGIPTQAQLDAVLDSIKYDDEARQTRRPLTATVLVEPITRVIHDIEISGLTPDTTEIRTAIEQAIQELYKDYEPYIQGITELRNDRITEATVVAAAQETAQLSDASFISLKIYDAFGALTSYVLEDGEKAKLGAITYV